MAPVCSPLSPGIRPARSQCFTDLQHPPITAANIRHQQRLTSSAPFDGQLINIELPWWYNSSSPQARHGHLSPGRVETLARRLQWQWGFPAHPVLCPFSVPRALARPQETQERSSATTGPGQQNPRPICRSRFHAWTGSVGSVSSHFSAREHRQSLIAARMFGERR